MLEQLIGKYGTDYGAMARDIKLNSMQHTSRVLRRKIERYHASGTGSST